VLQSGVRLFTTSRKSVTWPQLTQDMEADFYNELDEIVPTDLDFDDFSLTPQKIAALARGSSEVFDDSDPDLMQIVTSNMGTILGLKFDKQCLAGDVATTPKGFDGLLKIAGQTIDVGGALENWDPFIQAIGALAEQHVPGPYAIVTHSRVVTALDLVKEFTTAGSNVGLPRPANLPPIYVTSQIGLSGGTTPTTSALVYAPRFVTVVRRLEAVIEIDRSAEFTSDAVLVRGRVRATIGSPHTNAIVKLTNIAAPIIGGVTVSGTSAQPQAAEAQATSTRKR
jgi:HK97 family phage major capsid protein